MAYVESVDATVVVAVVGVLGTLAGVYLGGRQARSTDRAGRLLDARIAAYSECSSALHEYARAQYDRSKTRFAGRATGEGPEPARAYAAATKASACVGRLRFLVDDDALVDRLESVRSKIGDFSTASHETDLKQARESVMGELSACMRIARRSWSSLK